MSKFAPICIYLVISPLVSLLTLGLPFLFSSNSSIYLENLSAYECGFDPSGDSRSRFYIRFYLVSILFIIPYPEVTFSFPWAVPHNKIGPFWILVHDGLFIDFDDWISLRMEKGCFESGVTISERENIGGKDKGNSDAYIKSIDMSWLRRKMAHIVYSSFGSMSPEAMSMPTCFNENTEKT